MEKMSAAQVVKFGLLTFSLTWIKNFSGKDKKGPTGAGAAAARAEPRAVGARGREVGRGRVEHRVVHHRKTIAQRVVPALGTEDRGAAKTKDLGVERRELVLQSKEGADLRVDGRGGGAHRGKPGLGRGELYLLEHLQVAQHLFALRNRQGFAVEPKHEAGVRDRGV